MFMEMIAVRLISTSHGKQVGIAENYTEFGLTRYGTSIEFSVKFPKLLTMLRTCELRIVNAVIDSINQA